MHNATFFSQKSNRDDVNEAKVNIRMLEDYVIENVARHKLYRAI